MVPMLLKHSVLTARAVGVLGLLQDYVLAQKSAAQFQSYGGQDH
jgi:hypothetical protein